MGNDFLVDFTASPQLDVDIESRRRAMMTVDFDKLVYRVTADILESRDEIRQMIETMRTGGHVIEVIAPAYQLEAPPRACGIRVGVITPAVVERVRRQLNLDSRRIFVLTGGYGGCETEMVLMLFQLGFESVALVNLRDDAPADTVWVDLPPA